MELISKWNRNNKQKMRENILERESIKARFHSVYLGQMTTEKGCENTVFCIKVAQSKGKKI